MDASNLHNRKLRKFSPNLSESPSNTPERNVKDKDSISLQSITLTFHFENQMQIDSYGSLFPQLIIPIRELIMSKPSVDTSPMGTNGTASTTIPEPVDVIVHLMPDCVHVKRPLSSPLFPSNVVQPSSRSFCVFVLGPRRVFRNNQKKKKIPSQFTQLSPKQKLRLGFSLFFDLYEFAKLLRGLQVGNICHFLLWTELSYFFLSLFGLFWYLLWNDVDQVWNVTLCSVIASIIFCYIKKKLFI